MSAETSPGTGKRYGLQRVCGVLEVPRSTIYAQRVRAQVVTLHARRRGPKPKVSDESLLGPSGPIWPPRRSSVRVTVKCGRGCASCAGSVCRACGCCA